MTWVAREEKTMFSSLSVHTDGPARLAPRLHILLGSTTLASALLLSLLLAPCTHADLRAIAGCRSDPTFTLSNGAVLDIGVSIGAKEADVKGIAFTVSIPISTTVVSYDASTLGSIETYSVNANLAKHSYQTITYVTTRASNISVSATTKGHSSTGKGSVTEYGYNGQNLTAGLNF
jgi:hypothetical protein